MTRLVYLYSFKLNLSNAKIWLSKRFVATSVKNKSFFCFIVFRLKSIAIQHVVKENLPNTLMDRILQTRFVETFGWNSGLNVNGNREEMFDVSQYVQSLMDRHDDSVFYDRATARAVAGKCTLVCFLSFLILKVYLDLTLFCFF